MEKQKIKVCPECNSKDLKPYKNWLCCYGCGNLIYNKKDKRTKENESLQFIKTNIQSSKN